MVVCEVSSVSEIILSGFCVQPLWRHLVSHSGRHNHSSKPKITPSKGEMQANVCVCVCEGGRRGRKKSGVDLTFWCSRAVDLPGSHGNPVWQNHLHGDSQAENGNKKDIELRRETFQEPYWAQWPICPKGQIVNWLVCLINLSTTS